MIVKNILAIFLALIVVPTLFYVMSEMVGTSKMGPSEISELPQIAVTRTRTDSETATRERKLPEPPKETPPPPSVPMNLSTSNDLSSSDVSLSIPDLSATISGGIPFLGEGSGNTDLVPIVRINPQMPRKAAMRGIEGFVVAEFFVAKDGSTRDIKIVEASPKGVFERSAKRAILKWKYKPQVVDGKPTEVSQKVRLEFKLEEG